MSVKLGGPFGKIMFELHIILRSCLIRPEIGMKVREIFISVSYYMFA